MDLVIDEIVERVVIHKGDTKLTIELDKEVKEEVEHIEVDTSGFILSDHVDLNNTNILEAKETTWYNLESEEPETAKERLHRQFEKLLREEERIRGQKEVTLRALEMLED